MSTLIIRRRSLAISLGMTTVFVGLILYRLELGAVLSVLRDLTVPGLLVAALFLATDYTLRVIRWWRLLRTQTPGLPLGKCFGPFIASFAMNNLLPLRAGDILRCFAFTEHLRTTTSVIFGTVILERILDLLTLLGVATIGYFFTDDDAQRVISLFGVGWTSLACLGALVFLLPLEITTRAWAAGLRWIGPGTEAVRHFFNVLSLLRRPGLILELLVLSVFVWLLEGMVFLAVAKALAMKLSAAGALYAMGLGTLATLLPSSPGAFGTFDYGAMRGAIAFGTDREPAIVFALTVHFVLWAPISLLGIVYLGMSRDAYGKYRTRVMDVVD